MQTIAFATQKGGSGKSTLAIGLAVAAMARGHRVAVLDPLQAQLTPPGERSVSRELFDEIHEISLICDPSEIGGPG